MPTHRVFRSLFIVWLFVIAAAPAFGQGAGDSLMRLLKSGKLPESRYPAVVEMVARRGDASELKYLFEQATQDDVWSDDVTAVALNGLLDAAVNRKIKPIGDLAALERLLAPERPDAIRIPAIRLAGAWQVPALVDPMKSLVMTEGTPAKIRLVALESLANFGDQGRRTIETIAAEQGPLAVRSAAITALAGLDLNAAAGYAAKALAAAQPQDDPAQLLSTFLERQGGPDALAAALGQVKLPPNIAKASLRQMYSVGRSDGALSAALGQAAGIAMEDKPLDAAALKELSSKVLEEGDVERGELVFRRDDLSCLKCHAVSGAGGNIGPDLSAIGPSNPIDFLVASVLDPDAAVKEHYATQVVITTDGLIVTGIVADETDDRLVLRTAEGVDRSIPKADIELREKGNSLMPKGLVKFMTQDEFVDLVRFLSELGKPGTPYAVRSKPTLQRWRRLTDVPDAFATGIPDEATFRAQLPPAESNAWAPFYARVDGTLPLVELTGGSDRSVYLLTEIDVRTGGSVGLRIDDIAGLSVWVNGDQIDSVPHEFVTEFPEGRQTIVFRIDPAKRSSAILRAELFFPEGTRATAEPTPGL